jgi:NAD+ synthase
MRKRIVAQGIEYVKQSNVKSFVIGLSGGIDSTLTVALAREICDRTGIMLIGASLPTSFNKVSESGTAKLVGAGFCDEFQVHHLDGFVNRLTGYLTKGALGVNGPLLSIEPEAEQLFELKMRRGNIAARLRMIFLYHLAHEYHGLVLSTDNYTELMLGFWTLHGDVGDLGLIQCLWKTEVYGLAGYLRNEYLVRREIEWAKCLFCAIEAVPTDGLGITDSDLDQIGASSYEEVDQLLIAYLNRQTVKLSHPVIQRHISAAFKRDNPHNLQRNRIISR